MPKATQKQEILFFESQRFKQWWLWLLVGGAGLFTWYAFIVQIFLGEPVGNNPAPDMVVWASFIFCGVLLPAIFNSIRLVTTIDRESIRIGFFPLHKRSISLADVESYQLRQYRPVLDYGGWGIRRSHRGLAFIVSGKTGMQLVLRNGRKVLIGTQKGDHFVGALSGVIEPGDAYVDQ